MATSDNLLTIPKAAGRVIIEAGSVLACSLIGTDRFLTYCRNRGLAINRERLIRLEHLGLFAPIFRVLKPSKDAHPFHIPVHDDNNWFSKNWAFDTTNIPAQHDVPHYLDRSHEGYYSIFQLDHLDLIIGTMSLVVQLDSFLETNAEQSIDWDKNGKNWIQYAEDSLESLRTHEYRRSVALLCQYISNRYYPETQGDMRTIQVKGGYFSDQWIIINGHGWDWREEVREWKPQSAERLFNLTPEKLRYAYTGLAVAQAYCDPIEHWYPLIQFVTIHERARLKGNALLAETLRSGAYMLRLLHKDLYGEELPHPNEVTGTIINHIPELEIRKDIRRYLEFVVNRFNLNPQPKLALILEGQSEDAAVRKIFEKCFGTHLGTYGIEIIVLGSVDVATGSKKEDRFRAILRLIDYLHHHQTIAFIILDNENYATKLKEKAQRTRSIHSHKRHITRPEYIRIWKNSFEFDNFSCSEIAKAMSELAQGHANFTCAEVTACKNCPNPGASLKSLYKQKANYGLQKIKLSENLVDLMLKSSARRMVKNRPIVKMLERVARLAARNPLPTMHAIWEKNQASNYLGKKYNLSKK